MQQVLSYNASARQRNPLAGSVTDYYASKLRGGGVTDATRAKWAEMDNSVSAAGAQARMDQAQPGMFGQGRATRAADATSQTIMQQNSANKLKQAEMAAGGADSAVAGAASWSGAQDAQDRADRQFSYNTAKDLGDTVTQAGIGQQALGQQGYGYTGYGEQQMTDQAAQAKADADWLRKQQESQYASANESQGSAVDMIGNSVVGLGKKALKKGASALTGGLSDLFF